jgi:type I pantothenate kinase
MIDAPVELVQRARARVRPGHTTIIAVAGPVAVGKSTLCEALAAGFTAEGLTAAVVSTDGFLFPYRKLLARGLPMRKGFPESYDVDLLHGFLASIRVGEPEMAVPVYSHETYDIAPEPRVIKRSDFVVLEGVNALSATVGLVDLAVYVHADEHVVEAWYVDRFLHLCATAEPGTFYAQFGGLDADHIEELARGTWTSINLVNLREHIEPSRHHADVIVEKLANHEVGAIVDVARR